MNYGKLLSSAWYIAISSRKVWFFSTMSMFFLLFFDTARFSYQFMSTYNHIKERESFISIIINYARELYIDEPIYFIILSGIGIFMTLGFLFFPTFCYSVIVQSIIDIYLKKEFKILPLMVRSFGRFKKVWELDALLSILSIMEMFTIAIFVFNNLDYNIFLIVLPILIVAGIISIILSILSPFAYQYIVIDRLNIAESLKKSSYLVINNFREVLFLLLIGVIVFIRLVIEVLLAIFVPVLLVSLTTFLANSFDFLNDRIMIYIGIGLSAVFLFILIRILALIYIFTTALWTISWHELKNKTIDQDT